MVEEETLKTEVDTLELTETWRIHKNVVVLSLAFMVHFTAYSGVSNLQSSINYEAGLGTASLAAVHGTFIFSNVFLPAATIKWLGTKWAICLSFITYMPYIAAQLKPTFYTLIPTGLFVGLGAGPLWCAKCKYLSVVSAAHSKLSKISADVLLVRFLGQFFMIFQMSQVWGNLISSLVLSSGDNAAAVTSLNASMIPELCGANFLPTADTREALQPQPPEKVQMLAGIYLACMASGVLIVAFGVDSMKRYDIGQKSEIDSSGPTLLVTLKLLVEPNQLLLIVIIAFVGFQQAFFGADFTVALVSCAIGTGSVGFVMITCGLANAIGCVINGYLTKVTGRNPLICVAAILHAALFITFLTWRPQAGLGYVLYIIALLWGLCESIWVVQINAYNGILFPGREEAAFANYGLWVSVGYSIAYVISPYLYTSSKIYLMIAMMTVGLVGYFVVEFRERKTKKELEISQKVKEDVTKTGDSYNEGCANTAFEKIE